MATLHPPSPTSDHEALFEIYAAVQEIQKEQKRIANELKERRETLDVRCALEDRRLSRIEKWRATITGGLIVIGTLAGVAVGHVLRLWLP